MGKALVDAFGEARAAFEEADAACRVLESRGAGQEIVSPANINAAGQVVSPVLWEAAVRRLASEGVTTYVEVGPGTVLGGLVKKIHPDARITHFGAPDDLDVVMAACSI
jgi:malonyl CoA-acyl carrier protein transacylase